MLFCKETDEVSDGGDAPEPIAFNCDNNLQLSLVYDPPDWDSDDETFGAIVQKKQSPSIQKHVPAGIGEVETREQVLLQATWHVKIACCQHSLYKSLVNKARSDINAKTPHSKQTYTFVVDYGQIMEMPCF